MPVEFIPGDDESTDPPPPPEPRRRHSVLVRVAAAAIAVVAALAWALTRPDDTGVSGAPHPTVTTSASTTPPGPSGLPTGVQTVMCSTGAPMTTELGSAMQHFLPSIKLANLRVYRCVRGTGREGRIVFEAVTGLFHGLNIDVEATVRGLNKLDVSPRLGAADGHRVVAARIDAIGAGLAVSVIAYAVPHRHHAPPYDAMRRLADFVSLNIIL